MNIEALSKAARDARARAYCPYSHYAVGCAVETATGVIYAGCNVENVSFGLAICAERAAVSSMVSAGQQRIVRALVVTKDGGTPCGMCLQTMIEFAPSPEEVEVITENEAGTRVSYTLKALLPHGFSSNLG